MDNVRDLAYEAYKAGMKYKDIAEKYGVSLSAVKTWASRYWNKAAGEKVATAAKKVAAKKKLQPKQVADTNIDQVLIETIEENDRLTEKEKLFCLCYLKNFNATQAAINAGYSTNSARWIGYDLLTKTHIRAEIQRLKAVKAQSILASQEDLVERYLKIAFADMSDFAEWGREKQPVMNMFGPIVVKDEETGKDVPLVKEVNVVKLKGSGAVDGSLVSQIKQGKDGVSIKLLDQQKAMDWLDKYFLTNPLDKHKIDYDNARLALEKQKAEAGDDKDKPIEITIKRAAKN